MPPKRMTANPLQPLRYRPGKPVGQESSSSSEEESGSDSETESKPTTTTSAPPKATSFPKFSSNISKEELERRRQEAIALRAREAELSAKAQEGFETASESSDSDSDSAEEEDSADSSEEEEEAPTRKFIAPTFISKSKRQTLAPQQKSEQQILAEEETRRKEKADQLLQAQLEKDAAARAAGRKAWDDDDEAVAEEVDDTDNLDPESELAAWKLRELRRVKREREVIEAAEAEREELDRRRNLSVAEREAEDSAHLAAQQAEKEGKGKMAFMQKYFHKGAFFQDDETVEEVGKRDIMGGTFQDAGDRETLPQYMQIRDMAQLGRKGRSKYRDLKSEDTGRWGLEDRRGGAGGGGPGAAGNRYGDREGATGANAAVVGERRRREDEGDRGNKRPRVD